jgi:hypothetical protein
MEKIPTQQFIEISEIKNDVVILKDGSLRALLLASSLNFGLKSEEEQNAIISAYIQFLNTLESPVQIVIQSRPFNIKPYLQNLSALEAKQGNKLLKSQMQEYISFVKELVEIGEIMSKRFYVVVSYNPAGDEKQGFFSRLFSVFRTFGILKLTQERFEKNRERLLREVDKIASNLNAMGVKTIQLDTQSLIELFYRGYNLETSQHQDLTPVSDLQIEK